MTRCVNTAMNTPVRARFPTRMSQCAPPAKTDIASKRETDYVGFARVLAQLKDDKSDFLSFFFCGDTCCRRVSK